MIIRSLFLILISTCGAVFTGFGKDHGKKLQKGDVILIEAYTQQIIPGRRESRIVKETHFIIKWQDKNHPKSFIWFNGKDSIACTVSKTHKIRENNTRLRSDYYSENVALSKIKKGDTLDISVANGGGEALTAGLAKTPKNVLLYTTSNKNAVFGLRVDSIGKKRDIIMQ